MLEKPVALRQTHTWKKNSSNSVHLFYRDALHIIHCVLKVRPNFCRYYGRSLVSKISKLCQSYATKLHSDYLLVVSSGTNVLWDRFGESKEILLINSNHYSGKQQKNKCSQGTKHLEPRSSISTTFRSWRGLQKFCVILNIDYIIISPSKLLDGPQNCIFLKGW